MSVRRELHLCIQTHPFVDAQHICCAWWQSRRLELSGLLQRRSSTNSFVPSRGFGVM